MRAGFLFLLGFLVASCAAEAMHTRVVAEDPRYLVVLNTRQIATSPPVGRPYDHPASISAATLRLAFESVTVQPDPGLLRALVLGKPAKQPLLNPESAAILSTEISRALAEANPEERVDFYEIQPRDIATVSVTSGSLVVENGRILVWIRHFQAPLDKAEHPTMIDVRPIGQNMDGKELDFDLLEGPHASLRKTKNLLGAQLSDRHLILVDYVALVPRPPAPESPASSPEPLVPSAPPPAPGAPPTATEEGLEEKLRTLKRLRDEGLISEQEYIEKKRSLLKDF